MFPWATDMHLWSECSGLSPEPVTLYSVPTVFASLSAIQTFSISDTKCNMCVYLTCWEVPKWSTRINYAHAVSW